MSEITGERRRELASVIKCGSTDELSAEEMSEIMSDKELRELYLEYEKLSCTLKNAFADTPVNKDGDTLIRVLSKRIENGDVLPRYADSSKHHFPFATAACLLLAVFVLLVAGKNGALDGIQNAADGSDMDYGYPTGDEESAELTGFDNADVGAGEGISNGISEKQSFFYAANGEYNAIPSEESDVNGVPDMSGTTEEAAESGFAGATFFGVTSAEEESDSLRNDVYAPGAEEKAKKPEKSANKYENKNRMTLNATANSTSQSDFAVGNSANGIDGAESIPEDILERLDTAKLIFDNAGIEMSGDSLILFSDIQRLGEDNFREYFDQLVTKENFTQVFGLSGFTLFCEERAGE